MRHTVVHFIESADFGGAERALMYLVNGLDRQRWHPILFYHAGADSEMPSWIEEVHDAGVEVRAVPRLEGKWNMPHWPRFFADLRSAGASVFHAHLTWPLACTEALLLARLARVPVVTATMQLFWDLPYNTAMRLKRRLVAAAVDRYIAVSHENAGQMQAAFALPSDKLRVVHNAVDVDLFAHSRGSDPSLRTELAGTPDKPIVLTTARLTDQKGHHYLLEAAVQIPEAVFVLAGEGPERDALQAQAQRLGISDRVKFLGFRDDIPDLLASCDIFVLPSLYEGLPLALLEAAAAGKPVVAAHVGGVAEIVIDDETGLLVPPADPAALTAALRRLLTDPDHARRLAAAASTHVRRTFSVEAMARSVTSIYDQLLAERGPA